MDELLSSITEHANKLLGTDGCNLRLRKGNELILSYGTKDTINLMVKKRLKIGESLAGTIAKTKKLLIVEDLRDEKRYIKKHSEAAKNFGFVSFFGVPMLIEDELIGVICVYTKKPKRFIETEIELLSSFADQAAIAVRNAKILKKFKKQIE